MFGHFYTVHHYTIFALHVTIFNPFCRKAQMLSRLLLDTINSHETIFLIQVVLLQYWSVTVKCVLTDTFADMHKIRKLVYECMQTKLGYYFPSAQVNRNGCYRKWYSIMGIGWISLVGTPHHVEKASVGIEKTVFSVIWPHLTWVVMGWMCTCVFRPIHDAVEADNIATVRLLLCAGADISMQKYSGETVLHLVKSAEMKQFIKGRLTDSDLLSLYHCSLWDSVIELNWWWRYSQCSVQLKGNK